ncbi:hypothetical protein GCM10010921_00930 [Microbacterium album]|uniref:Uncharacterized protein n=2 Tax=Microbacterium album TaxID=2053191 RepID=A0A917IC47_9MICO|nr:hypothetical protein GCM10010921_00930 [Microbacterium album]
MDRIAASGGDPLLAEPATAENVARYAPLMDTTEPRSEVDLAIERALEASNLRAGDSLGASAAVVVEDRDLSAAESGELDGPDGD